MKKLLKPSLRSLFKGCNLMTGFQHATKKRSKFCKSYLALVIIWIFFVSCKYHHKQDADLLLAKIRIINIENAKISKEQDVFIKDDTIVAILPTSLESISGNFRIIDCTGKFLIPGFIDSHAHLSYFDDIPQVMEMLIAYGVTAVRDPGTDADLETKYLQLADSVNAGLIFGPKIFTCGSIISSQGYGWETEILSQDEIVAEVMRKKKLGVDFIKIYESVHPEFVDQIIQQAHAQNLKVIGHLGETSWNEAALLGIDGLVHSGLNGPTWELLPEQFHEQYKALSHWVRSDSLFDLSLILGEEWLKKLETDDSRVDALISTLANADVIVDPNLVLAESFYLGDDLSYYQRIDTSLLNPNIVRNWHRFGGNWSFGNPFINRMANWKNFSELSRKIHSFNKKLVYALYQGGVRLTAGTDLCMPWIVPGYSLHRELELLTEAGMSSEEVLKIAFINNAMALNNPKLGRVEVAGQADLVILEANPLERITNTKKIFAVIKSGKVFSKAQLIKMGNQHL